MKIFLKTKWPDPQQHRGNNLLSRHLKIMEKTIRILVYLNWPARNKTILVLPGTVQFRSMVRTEIHILLPKWYPSPTFWKYGYCFPCRWKWIYWCNSYLYIKNTIMTILSAHIFIFFLPPPKPFLAIFPPSPGEGWGKTFSKNWISICITWVIIFAKTVLT